MATSKCHGHYKITFFLHWNSIKLMTSKKIQNIAFVDGQNLYMATAKKQDNPWEIDMGRFRVYLLQKEKGALGN